jgi:hypothetical protein
MRFLLFIASIFLCGPCSHGGPGDPSNFENTDSTTLNTMRMPTVTSTFESDGIGFEVPNGWAMTDTLDAGGGYYVACERQGDNQSGMISVTRVEDKKIKLAQMMAQRVPKGCLVENAIFKGYKSLVAQFSNEDSGVKMTKTVYVFEACDAKYVFSSIGESQNEVQNQADFQAIIQSWKCR